MSLDSFFPAGNPLFFFIVIVWSIFWKGFALWRAARLEQRNWFIVILVVSTIGILEIVYLFGFARKRLTIDEIRSWFNGSKKKS